MLFGRRLEHRAEFGSPVGERRNTQDLLDRFLDLATLLATFDQQFLVFAKQFTIEEEKPGDLLGGELIDLRLDLIAGDNDAVL